MRGFAGCHSDNGVWAPSLLVATWPFVSSGPARGVSRRVEAARVDGFGVRWVLGAGGWVATCRLGGLQVVGVDLPVASASPGLPGLDDFTVAGDSGFVAERVDFAHVRREQQECDQNTLGRDAKDAAAAGGGEGFVRRVLRETVQRFDRVSGTCVRGFPFR